MKIAIDCGHTLSGADTGAQGCGGKEENRTREIGNIVINELRELGHEVINCTVDSCSNLNESLSNRVNKANSNKADVFISIHLNAYNTKARGVEVHVSPNCSSKSIDYAQKVQKELSKLGYVNRGVKKTSLYVCNNTNMPAILVECGFIDNDGDMKLYNACNIAKAIIRGLTGEEAQVISSQPGVSFNTATKSNNWVSRLQDECNKQGFSNQVVDGIPGPITLAGCPTIKIGATGNITRLLQEKLNSLGFNCGNVDGMFGENTRQAVMRLQSARGLYVDGIVGAKTWSKLLGL